jgi:hypothetical protein
MPALTPSCFQMAPVTIGLDIYERHVRTVFPRLPSIRNLLLSVRMEVLGLFAGSGEGGSSAAAAGRSRQGNQNTTANAAAAPLPTLNVDLNAIRAGGS